LLFLAPLPRATIPAKPKQEQEAFIYHHLAAIRFGISYNGLKAGK
jgi:hypothetical protein